MKDLDGDLAVVLEIPREIHRRHTARAEFPLDAVTIISRLELSWARTSMGAAHIGMPAQGEGSTTKDTVLRVTRRDGFTVLGLRGCEWGNNRRKMRLKTEGLAEGFQAIVRS